jgi:glycosyltransferase involved in cell wall biosynthesis
MGKAARFVVEAFAEGGTPVHRLQLTTPGRADSAQGQLTLAALVHLATLFVKYVVLLGSRRIDVVYMPIAQWGLPLARDTMLVATARMLRVPVFIHLHGSQLVARLASERSGLPMRLCFLTVRGCHWGVLSHRLERAIRAIGVASVSLLRNPALIPETSLAPAFPRRGAIGVGFLGLTCTAKGTDLVVDAVRQLQGGARGQVTLTIAGPSGNYRSEPHPGERILGKQTASELESTFWPLVDLLLLPARWEEGFPFVILEALTRGRLVATTPASGLADLVAVGALITIDPTVESVARLINDCINHGQTYLEHQQTAWRSVAGLFDPKVVQADWMTAIHKARAR